MNELNFVYWLQGRLEDRDLEEKPLTIEEQIMVQEHLKLVFKKETPTIGIGKTGVPVIDWGKTAPYTPPFVFPTGDWAKPYIGDSPHIPGGVTC